MSELGGTVPVRVLQLSPTTKGRLAVIGDLVRAQDTYNRHAAVHACGPAVCRRCGQRWPCPAAVLVLPVLLADEAWRPRAL